MADEKDQKDVPGMSTGRRGFTRREFLFGTGMFVYLAANYATAKSPSPIPVFTKRSGLVTLSWLSEQGTRTWTIDTDWFLAEGTKRRSLKLLSRQILEIRGRFAGVNIPVNVRILIVWRKADWAMEWLEGDRLAGTISLSDWFAGKEMPLSLSRWTGPAPERTEMKLDGDFTGTVRWPFSYRLRSNKNTPARFLLGQSKGVVEGVDIEPYAALMSEASLGRLVLPAHVAQLLPATTVSKVRVTADVGALDASTRGWALGKVSDNELHLVPQLPKVIVEVVKDTRNDELIMGWRHGSSGEARLVIGTPDGPQSLFVDQAEFVEIENGRYSLGFCASRQPRLIKGEGFLAVARGDGHPQFIAEFRKKPQLALQLILQTLHVRGEDQARYDIDFRQYVQEGSFLDRSSIDWGQQSVNGVEALLTLGALPKKGSVQAPNLLHLGTNSALDVSLDTPGAHSIGENAPVLRVRRHEDALDLGLTFHGYRLKSDSKGAWLDSAAGARRGVRFHPQHLQEEVFESPAPPGIKAGMRRPGDDALFAGKGITTKLSRTRVSGASRVIFAQEQAGSTLRLSVQALTDWSKLTLAVPLRADLANRPLNEQIKGIGIDIHTDRQAAKCKVAESLKAPAPDETALELVTGLVFSPDPSARFRVPGRIAGNSAWMWTAQLELQPVKPAAGGTLLPPAKVRAVWASDFDANEVFDIDCGAPPPPPDLPFQASLSAQYRREIMLLSSGIGLAALRAVNLAGQDVPSSRVRIPVPDFDYVIKPAPVPGNPPPLQQEGVMSPAPFARFNARLSPYGVDLDAEWTGEPAAPLGKQEFFKKALNVEKYLQRVSLGSDVYVEVVEKAFLFPYGFRVTLVSIVEREPWTFDDMGAMMPAIKRYFILPKPVEKTYPGIYQPFQGLEIPVRHARLAFEISPELDASQMILKGSNGAEMTYQGQVFWPKHKGLGTEILFDFLADDTGVRRSVPMLFVDNAAVHDPATMSLVMDYYNALDVTTGLRTELHYGGRTVFAEPKQLGDTSFVTDHLILKARSRVVVPVTGKEAEVTDAAFVMDAYMEGADEPPFYPVMVEASISVPALDRLMGEPQGLKRVGYISNYLHKAFDAGCNPGELFLCFLDPGLMNMNGKGRVSGGVAQTPTAIAGISRSNAIVGAKSSTPKAVASLHASGTPAVGVEDAAPWDFTDSFANKFVPKDFFRDAQLLGILKFADVVKPGSMLDQPKLTEIYDYAVAQADGKAHDVLVEACKIAAHAIITAMRTAETALKGFFEDGTDRAWVPVTTGATEYPNLEKCYPDLTVRLNALSEILKAAAATSTFEDIIRHASTIMDAWRNLKGAVDAVIANPTPEPVRGVIGTLRVLVDGWQIQLGEALRVVLDQQLRAWVDPFVNQVLDYCFKPAEPVTLWLFDAVFGALRPERDPALPPRTSTREELRKLVETLLEHPEEIPPALLASPLGKRLTIPLLTVLASVKSIEKTLAENDADKAVEMARSVLQDMLELLASSHALLQATEANAAELCQEATSALPEVAKLAGSCLPTAKDIANATQMVTHCLNELDLPGLPTGPLVDDIRRKTAKLRANFQEVAKQLVEISTLRQRFDEGLAKDAALWCKQPGRMAVDVSDLVRSRTQLLDAIRACVAPAQQLAQAIEHLPDAIAANARHALYIVRHELAILSYRGTVAAITTLDAAGRRTLEDRFNQLPDNIGKHVAHELEVALSKGPKLTEVVTNFLQRGEQEVTLDKEFADLVETACLFIGNEYGLFALATDFTVLHGKMRNQLMEMQKALAQEICQPLISLHTVIRDYADTAIEKIKEAPDLVLLLSRSVLARLELVRHVVNEDLTTLVEVKNGAANAAAVLEHWQEQGGAGLVIAARTLSELFFAVARGQIGVLFNLEEARRAIEDVVRRLIPSRVSMRYEWAATLQAVPKDGPIFMPVPIADKNDLVIKTRIDVDLLRPQDRSVSVEGVLQPFDVHLWGDSLDLVTLKFSETRFHSLNGNAPTFSTRVEEVKIGNDLNYLSKFGALLSPKGSGFSMAPTFDPPGLKVGYSLAYPIVQLGALTVLNLGFEVSALLPFDGSQAQLGFSVGTEARPFGIIVQPCYYGGGFISLLTNARDVLRFQIQFEFGAATAIEFGPLSGQGRVTSGFYLLVEKGGRSAFKGFVHAIGEGQVACFGICVNLEVAVEHQKGTMTGTSSYQFSFKVGFIELSYRVTAAYTFRKDTSNGQVAKLTGCLPPFSNTFVVAAVDKQVDWDNYRVHFAKEWK